MRACSVQCTQLIDSELSLAKLSKGVLTHDVGLEVLVEVHRVDGLLDHGMDLIVADVNLAHCGVCRMGVCCTRGWVMGQMSRRKMKKRKKKTLTSITPGFSIIFFVYFCAQ